MQNGASNDSPILFSIIVPAHRRPESLAKCLAALTPGTQTVLSEKYEVIVSDDSPPTESNERLIHEHFPWAKWIAGPRRGPSANRNNGVRHSHGTWVIFFDDDCIPDPGTILAYENIIARHPSVSVFEGRTYADRPRRSLAEFSPVNESGGCLWSCNFSIRRTLFEAIGRFDERFPYAAMEDVEFRMRLEARREPICFVREAAVCHPWRHLEGSTYLERHKESLDIFLTIHPDSIPNFGPDYFLRVVLKRVISETLPGLWHYKGVGVTHSLREHLFYIKVALHLWRHSRPRNPK